MAASRAADIVDGAMEQIGSSTVIATGPLLSSEQLIRAVTVVAWVV